MNPHRELIASKLRHMRRMREYLAHSHGNLLAHGIIGKPVGSLTLQESEILAAFRRGSPNFRSILASCYAPLRKKKKSR